MFDVGFSELGVIGIVALVVIGPERLPKVARTAGLLLGRMQRYVNSVKADISREIQLDELKKLQSDMQESARNFEQSISGEIRNVEEDLHKTVEVASAGFMDPPSGAAPSATESPVALAPPPVGPSEPTASVTKV